MAVKVKKESPVVAHAKQNCDCFNDLIPSANKRCVYQQFPDGWDFTPDVGRSKSHAEVFTPLWVVRKMINDTGAIPTEVIYSEDYPEYTTDSSLMNVLEDTILDMACGTGNYASTVMFTKLTLAKKIWESDKTQNFDELFLKAVSSVFAFDIDYGNANTVYHRLFTDGATQAKDVDRLAKLVQPFFTEKVALKDIKAKAKESIVSAEANWGQAPQGLVNRFYEETTGEEMSAELLDKVRTILSKNILVFNGISDSDDLDMMVAGNTRVVWTFWNVGEDLTLTEERVPLMCQVLSTKILEAKEEVERIEEKYPPASDDLFSDAGEDTGSPSEPNFGSDKDAKREYSKLLDHIADLEEQRQEAEKLA